jgi:hypothetical protein
MIRSKDCGGRQAVMNLPCLIAFVFLSCKCLMAQRKKIMRAERHEPGGSTVTVRGSQDKAKNTVAGKSKMAAAVAWHPSKRVR